MPELTEFGSAQSALDLREALWSMAQRSRMFQELRKDISHTWHDEAARDINGRHLNPLEEDDGRMRTSLNQQDEMLSQAHQQLALARELSATVDACAVVVSEKLRFAQQDMDSSYSNYDLYVHFKGEAESKFPRVHQLISRANAACG